MHNKSCKIIGKGIWIDKLAAELIERETLHNRDTKIIRVESGLGASGVPHLGSLGDAVRSYGVKLALENLGYKSELIAYSDDLDGLRKVPYGFSKSLERYLGNAVSDIPDPNNCHDSYGMHMSDLLLDGLKKLKIKYIFRRARDAYKNGLFQNEIHTILSNHEIIGEMIKKITGQEKYIKYMPYFPICKNCNKIYTTNSYEYLQNEKKVRYNCNDVIIGKRKIKGCNYNGESSIINDKGKLSWKVEFAARWHAFDIRFEAYGKDITESVKINDWISDNILKYNHPYHIKYEMFLDKKGKKISKSIGNVITSQKWLRYGTPESILLLLYKRIIGAREVNFENIPILMEEYNRIEDVFFGKTKISNKSKEIQTKGLYEYVNLLLPPKKPSIHVNYRLLIELSKIFRKDRINSIINKLREYKMINNQDQNIKRLIKLAGNYADDFEINKIELKVDQTLKKILKEIRDELVSDESNYENIQNRIFDIARSNKISPSKIFTILYQITISSTSGPKINKLITYIGIKQIIKLLNNYIN